MENAVKGKIVVMIGAETKEDSLDGLLLRDCQLKRLVLNNKEVFDGMSIDCSINSILKLREVGRRELTNEGDVRRLLNACYESDFDSVKPLAEICFLEREKEVILKHYMNCQKKEIEKYGLDVAFTRLFEGIKNLGKATSSHYILSMEG